MNRSSDPLIGAGVNAFARNGLSVTLANPVGLFYMQTIGIDGLRDPAGAPIGTESLRLVRASPDRMLILGDADAVDRGLLFVSYQRDLQQS